MMRDVRAIPVVVVLVRTYAGALLGAVTGGGVSWVTARFSAAVLLRRVSVAVLAGLLAGAIAGATWGAVVGEGVKPRAATVFALSGAVGGVAGGGLGGLLGRMRSEGGWAGETR